MTGICKDTVLKLLCDLGAACKRYHDAHVRGLNSRRVQCDETWNFCYGKDKNVTDEQKAESRPLPSGGPALQKSIQG